jgi:ribose transport system substrate-binding protein
MKEENGMKKTLTCLLVVSLVVMVAFNVFAADKKFKIGFVPGVADPFYYTMEKGAQAKAKELGVDLIVGEYPRSWGPEAQVPIIEAIIARGDIDLFFTAPTSTEALIPVLKKIHDKGIPVITVDTYLGDGDYTKESNYSFPLAYIGTDNVAGGKVVAEALAKMIGEKGKVMVENTNPDVSSVQGREKGFVEGMKQFPNIQVVAIEYCLDNQGTAQAQVSAVLQKNPDLVGVFGVNVFSAQGAYRAIVNAGLTGAVKIATWDATQDLINALKKGEVDMILAQMPAEMGSLCVEWGYKILKGEAKEIPNKKVVPGFFVFTKENVDKPESQQYIYTR